MTVEAPPVRAYLALGSNLGDRAAHLRAGIDGLATEPKVRVVSVSPFYETPPWGPIPQGPYLNACTEVETSLPPRALLGLCLALERAEGRERLERWGPRTLDIDILTYGDAAIDEPDLTVPHPRMAERAFVLVPLAALAPALTLGGRPIAEILAALHTSGIVRWTPPD
jgi:2-amino-4-hydroxy-6-hydroxymethyldihydropteridine diphosphokinase